MLTSIELRNFKCFREQAIAVKPLTLLTGINGVGKSSAFQSILLLKQSIERQMLPDHGLLLNGPLLSLGTASDVLYRGADQDEVIIGLGIESELLNWSFAYDNPHSDVLRVIRAPSLSDSIKGFGDDFHYLAAERVGPRSLYEMSHYEVSQQHRLGADGRYAAAYLDSNRDNEATLEVRHPDAADSTVGSQVEAWFGSISPGTQLTTTPFFEVSRLTLGFGFEGGRPQAKLFSPPNVGFGLSFVLPVIVALVTAKRGTLVLIENPEAHLHPKGQLAMGLLLAQAASGGVQVIVETHSEHVLNGVRIAVKRKTVVPTDVSIGYFERYSTEGVYNHVVQYPTLDADGRLSNWPDGFFDQWEGALELL